jgi:sugar/nucleoside kinase (ribokinase family)
MAGNMSRSNNGAEAPEKALGVQVVCFGMITPAVVLAVDRSPDHNTGTAVEEIGNFISDDAAIVAVLLRRWGVQSSLIGTAVGDDTAGRQLANQLQEAGVAGNVRLSSEIKTPLEVNISDPTGGRTYFWQRDPEVLATLDTADLAMMEGAQLLYVDWYDGHHICRPMAEAARLGMPVFLNLEHGHQDPEAMAGYAKGATICQAVTDPAQRGGDPFKVAERLLDAGVEIALVTLGPDGSVVAAAGEVFRVNGLGLPVRDGCAAGATYSAAFAYGYLLGWTIEETARFAAAAASLKCTVVGPRAFPLGQIHKLAEQVKINQSTFV